MSILNKLSQDEKTMLMSYIENYAFSGAEGGEVKASFDHLFRLWDASKSEYLFNIFGQELILQKNIVYKKTMEDLEDGLTNALFSWHAQNETAAGKFMAKFYGECYTQNFTSAQVCAWQNLCSVEVLATNCYNGETVSIQTPDGKEIKIVEGGRATRVIGKLAKAFNIDEGFEEFRIAHSMVLNQKELKGNLCISIHPMDYFTMSDNDCDWESCMSWQQNGCYRMGTVEMMNSPMVVVAYLTSSDDMYVPTGKWNSKKWRELYIVTEDIITNVKAYPYKNENLTKEVIAWLKELAEKAGYSKYDEVPFSWVYNYQSEAPRLDNYDIRFDFSTYQMYNDFDSDAGQWSYLREDLRNGGTIWITYSGETECMCCGSSNGYYDGEGALVCDNCEEIFWCENCEDTRIYDGDVRYDVDGMTICSSCYEYNTEECIYSGKVHMRYNCVQLFVMPDEDLPIEGRKVYYDRGWRERGCRPLEKNDVTTYTRNGFYIYEDKLEEAIEEFSKSGKYKTLRRRYESDIYAIPLSDVTEEFARAADFENLEDFVKYYKTLEEWEVL